MNFDERTAMTTHEQLVAGRNLLDATQWRCGPPNNGDGPGLCVEEALGIALGYPDWEHQNSDIRGSEAYRVLSAASGSDEVLYLWNDFVCQGKADALDLFDRAIASTAPVPAFDSLTTEPATAREPVTEVFA